MATETFIHIYIRFYDVDVDVDNECSDREQPVKITIKMQWKR